MKWFENILKNHRIKKNIQYKITLRTRVGFLSHNRFHDIAAYIPPMIYLQNGSKLY